MNGRILLNVTPTEEGLLAQYEQLRRERPKIFVGDEVQRWLETHNLSQVEKAAGYVVQTLTFLRENHPKDQILNSERAEIALRAEVVKWAPRFAKLWEGRAHFTIFVDAELDYASYLGLATHDGDNGERPASVIFTDAQKAIDEGALTLLASVGEKGKELSDGIRERIKHRDEICDRYFDRRGVEKAKRHTDWEFVADTNAIRRFLSIVPLQAIHDADVKKVGEEYFKEYPLEDTHPLVYIKEERDTFLAETGIKEEEFKPLLWDLWQSGAYETWTPNVQVPRWAKWLMVALWTDVVAPQIEREIAREKENTLVPSGLITTLRDGRRDGGLILGPFGPWGEGGTPTIAVIPQKGISLFLSFDADVVQQGSKGTVSLRQAINGYQMRVLLASYTAWLDEGRDPGGKFIFDENIFLGDYLGLKHIDRSDQKGLRFSSTTRKALRSAFDALRGIQVKSFGDIEASEPEPLIQQYHQKSTGKHLWYRHAPLLIDAVHEHYTQFPRAVLRQEANDAALSIGMASFVREKALVLMDHNGTHEAPLSYWLEKAGEDPTEGKRKLGNAYFQKASDRLKRAIQEGEIGSFSGAGDRATSVLTFAADPKLLFAYEPLKKARGKRIKAARIGEAIAIANSKKAKG